MASESPVQAAESAVKAEAVSVENEVVAFVRANALKAVAVAVVVGNVVALVFGF